MVNKVILIGNIGGDAERVNENIAKFNLATTEHWNDKEGNRQEKTEWHKVVVYNKLADIVEKLGKRGTKVYVEGKLTTREWTNEAGEKRYTTEVKIDINGTFQVLSSKNDGSAPAYSNNNKDSGKSSTGKKDTSKSAPKENVLPEPPKQEEPSPADYAADDDDIPF
jgi:single-strand DNA-binding protein